MEKSIEQLEEELRTIAFRLRGINEDIALKVKEGDKLHRRKISLLDKILGLENE